MKIIYNLKKFIFKNFFMKKENLKLRYFWEPWKDNEINAKDIAWSLLALSDLLNIINENYWKSNKEIELKVKWWNKWSFVTDLVIISTSFSWPILSLYQSWLWIKEMLELLWLTWWAWVIWFIKQLGWEKPIDVKNLWDNVIVTNWSWNNITVSKNIYNIYQNKNIQENLKLLKEPLDDKNIFWLEVDYSWKKETIIDENNKDYFDFDSNNENEIIKEETKILLKIVLINFDYGKKWKFKALWIEFWASILDEKFSKELWLKNFSRWDELFVTLETKKVWEKIIERNILKVLEHVKAPKQTFF